jgi:phage shock protein E
MKYTIIDVREPDEYNIGHVKNAINMPSSVGMNSAKILKDVSTDEAIIVYCRSGKRADAAKTIMEGLGYSNVINGVSQQQVEAQYGL